MQTRHFKDYEYFVGHFVNDMADRVGDCNDYLYKTV